MPALEPRPAAPWDWGAARGQCLCAGCCAKGQAGFASKISEMRKGREPRALGAAGLGGTVGKERAELFRGKDSWAGCGGAAKSWAPS